MLYDPHDDPEAPDLIAMNFGAGAFLGNLAVITQAGMVYFGGRIGVSAGMRGAYFFRLSPIIHAMISAELNASGIHRQVGVSVRFAYRL